MSASAKLARPLPSTRVRRALFQVHLWSGIGLSLYVLAICVSGSAIVFRRELDRILCPATLTVPVRAHRLTTTELASLARARYPRFDLTHIEVRDSRTPNAPAEVVLSGGGARLDRLFDPYTGADLTDAVSCEPHWVTTLTAFHDDLSGSRTGRTVNGCGALAVLLLCLSGAIVWWPGKEHLRRGMSVRWHVSWHRFLRDLHAAVGFWLVLIVLMWATTGIYFAFPNAFNRLTDSLVKAGAPSQTVDDAVAWVVRLHFGRAFGRSVEVLWVILGLLPIVLVVTGVIMWWHRVQPVERGR
jgi:uncharacterized iron-regulated membrane protein